MSTDQVTCKYCGKAYSRNGVNNHIVAMHPDEDKMDLPAKSGQSQDTRDDKGRFKEGQSGNPDGPGAGYVQFKTKFQEAVTRIAEKREDLEPEDVDVKIVMRGVVQALNGNFKFFKDILDRRFGKAQKNTDITTAGESLNKNSEEFKENMAEIQNWLENWGDNQEN